MADIDSKTVRINACTSELLNMHHERSRLQKIVILEIAMKEYDSKRKAEQKGPENPQK